MSDDIVFLSVEHKAVLFPLKAPNRLRKVVNNPETSPRIIIKCIGRLKLEWLATESTGGLVGTATVFKYDKEKRICYALSCAHNVTDMLGKTNNKKKTFLECEDIKFERINGNGKVISSYDIIDYRIHPKYSYNDDCSYDLLILKFIIDESDKSDIFYYETIFDINNKFINETSEIKLSTLNKCLKKQFNMNFEIYGYPSKRNDPKFNGSILFGMSTADNNTKTQDFKVSICLKNDEIKTTADDLDREYKQSLFIYDAIDTEDGQSGASIFVELPKQTIIERKINKENKLIKNTPFKQVDYHIVGVHSGGEIQSGYNWGVAFTSEHINWINNVIINMNSRFKDIKDVCTLFI